MPLLQISEHGNHRVPLFRNPAGTLMEHALSCPTLLTFFALFVIIYISTEGVKKAGILFWFEAIFGWLFFPVLVLGYSLFTSISLSQGIGYISVGIVSGIFSVLSLYLLSEYDKAKGISNSNHRNVGKFLDFGSKLAILGKPGSGKSTYIQFIALAFARDKASDRKLKKRNFIKNHLGFNEWYLPILIPLRRVAGHINDDVNKNNGTNALLDAFRQKILPSELREGFSDEYIRYMLKRKKVLFLFDGLDEVAGDNEFETIVNEIKGVVSTYPGNRYIISSRYSGWRGGVGSQFIETEIKDLDSKQIDGFIDNWYRAIAINRLPVSGKDSESKKFFREEKAREKGDILKQTLRSVESVRNLASNPLLLSMICFVHYNKTLPEERLSLYQDCSRLLLEQWEIEKGTPKDDIPLTYARKEIIMQEIAYAIHSGEISNKDNARETTGQKAIQSIRKTLEKFNIDSAQAETLFNKLVVRTGLLVAVENYKDVYQFSHLTFQEFFTARRIFDNNLDILACIKMSSYNNINYLVSWWKEVILLYSGMKRNPTQLINQLLTEDSDTDFLKVRLQIAAQCISEAVEKTAIKTEKLVLKELWQIRTLGKRKVLPAKTYPEIREFLLRFATSYEYYDYVLREKVEDTNKKNIKKLINQLKEEIDTNDSDIQNAAVGAINLLWRNHDLARYLTNTDVSKLLRFTDLNLLLHLTSCVSKKRVDDITDELIEEVVKETAGYIVDSIQDANRDIGYADEEDELAKTILQEMRTDVFQNHWGSIKTKILEAISTMLVNPPLYNSYVEMPKRAFLKYIIILLEVLSQLSTEEENSIYKAQLINMARMGKINQQVLGTLLLSKIYSNDTEIENIVANKLVAPSLNVRMAALIALRNVEIEEAKKITYYKNAIGNYEKSKSKSVRVLIHIKEILLGKGVPGSSVEEFLYAISSISLLEENPNILISTLDNISKSDYYDTFYKWVDGLIDILPLLPEKEIDRLMSLAKDEDMIDFYTTLVKSYDKLPDDVLTQIVEVGNNFDDIKTDRLLESIKNKAKLPNSAYDLIKLKLIDGSYIQSSLAFDVLIKQNYI